MPISKDHLVDVLRYRYDAYSAEAVFTQACVKAGLDGTTSFDQRALMSFRGALERVGDRVGGVLARIDALLEDAPAAEAKPESKAEAKAEKGKTKGEAKAEPKAEEKPETKVDAKPETKVDAKPDTKVDAKPDTKVDAKPDAATGTTITLRGLKVDDGEMVLVCGEHPTLGDWEPDDAALMSPAGDTWTVTLDLPADAEVAFKFLIQDKDGDVTWEPGGNRTVRANQQLDATWRDAS